MKSLRTIFRYVGKYPKLIFAYFGCNILSNIFSVVSLGLLSPFLLLIFKKQDTLANVSSNTGFLSRINPINFFKEWLNQTLQTPNGDIKGLAAICILIVTFILLKNIKNKLLKIIVTCLKITSKLLRNVAKKKVEKANIYCFAMKSKSNAGKLKIIQKINRI